MNEPECIDEALATMDSCHWCREVFVIDDGCPCRRPASYGLAIYNLTEWMLEWIDADHVINGLSPLDVGWTVEAPMRDRAQALDRLWTEDGRRQRVKGIASIWT